MHCHLLYYLLPLLICFTGLVEAQVSFVAAGGIGDGTSWAKASGDLQAILASSTAGSEIWVAQGTYYPTQCSTCTFDDKNETFQVPDGVALYGGFVGNEMDLSQRDWTNNTTILSGDINQDGSVFNNAYTILYMRNVSAATIVDGFEITESFADNGNYDVYTRQNSGGGLYNDGSLNGGASHPTIRNCRFTNHYGRGFGAAIMNYGGFGGHCSPEIINCEFANNETLLNGGAVYNSGVFSGRSDTSFKGCTFTGNQANNGGAIYNQGSESGATSITYEDCTFSTNSAMVWGGAIVDFGNRGTCLSTYLDCSFTDNSANQGGAILGDGSFEGICSSVFTNCEWTNNWANNGGGAIYSQGPFEGEANPEFRNCVFNDNGTNGSGGALFNNGQEGNSNPTIINTIFTQNKANMYGGGMYNFGKTGHSNPQITNCRFIRNEGQAAGAIYNYGGVNGESSPIVTNCTFFRNKAQVGPCIYNQAADTTGTVKPIVSNCIFWGNISISGFGLVFQNGYAEPTIKYSLIQVDDCIGLNTDPNSNVTCGTGILFNIDPKFVDTLVEDLHLQSDSPVLNIGDNNAINATGINIDLDSTSRIHDSVVDFGVYEYHTSAYQAPVILSQSPGSSTCEAEDLTLYVVTNGTPPLTYQWKKEGIPISGASDSLFSITAANSADAGIYTCEVSSSIGDRVQSNPIEITVDSLLEVQIDIQASAISTCAGESITFTAQTTNGGTNPQYSWQVNGQASGGNQDELILNDSNDGDEVTCLLSSSETCTTGNQVSSNSIALSVQEILVVSLTLDASTTNICAGEAITFTANPVNAGSSPLYRWYLNAQEIQLGQESITLDTLRNDDQISCEVESSESCIEGNPASSNTIAVEVNPLLEIDLSISASAIDICEGEAITFDAISNNGGANPEYTWLVNGLPVMGDTAQLILDNLQNGDLVSCQLTSSEMCTSQNPVLSNAIPIQVSTPLMVDISIIASPPVICEGGTIMLSASTENGGSDPEYTWLLNGQAFGNNSPDVVLSNPANGDKVTCELRSSETCVVNALATSNTLEIEVLDNLEATISIEASALSICEGEIVALTALVENGGMNPEYKWLIDGVNQNVNAAVLETSNLDNGALVRCELLSSETCVVQNPVISNGLNFVVKPVLEANIEIDVNATTSCLGDTLFFEAQSTNAGSQPFYQWLLDGIEIGENTPFLSIASLPLGTSTVRCALTSSEECLLENPVASDIVEIEVINSDSCITSLSPDIPGIEQAYVYPNPSLDNSFTLMIEGQQEAVDIVVRDVQGRLHYAEYGVRINQKKTFNIIITDAGRGMFLVHLIAQNSAIVVKAMLL